jgi:hypothetical protein
MNKLIKVFYKATFYVNKVMLELCVKVVIIMVFFGNKDILDHQKNSVFHVKININNMQYLF